MTKIPNERTGDFTKAGQLAINIIYSDEFQEQLSEYMRSHPASPEDTVWAGLTPEGITAALRAQLRGINVTTYGGIRGAWLAWRHGNTGLDGGGVAINRYALDGRRASQIANTIVHEAAHGAGMTHPESDRPGGLPLAFCQPPYVIGTIVERIAEGPSWVWNNSQHCTTFDTA
jgi:hypothetical protein